ncbi:electron transport complex subunit RsxB [Undibacterium oligocarboniphilum]|uniref:Electron transport complex subunit RsxB n=1 Tax=Undibacterium oligocarboniphilum TaxID=666702 RepID=A0A850QHC1_9BURK|nr:electron transport complex subunit RsxB [Undibacterium oligocarboniphilum]MBC3868865.1 electron transport complex subunit RsxB [Undibacterium oligocarboniphilum]NVO76845.1 electron transport complex subunit RsxB [Undibacterium oligocarboniphilum]
MAVFIPLVTQIEHLLPQTQCTKCGFPSCHEYASAIVHGAASYNQCPPGGQEGVVRLATLLQQPIIPLNIHHGEERERPLAVIEEAYCIGCTLCIQACPVDAIIGAPKQMHSVIPELCTGCDLCVAPCPVDCITMVPVTGGQTGWAAWSQPLADQSRRQFEARNRRLVREKAENEERLAAKAAAKLKALEDETTSNEMERLAKERKKNIITAAIERARLKKIAAESGKTEP